MQCAIVRLTILENTRKILIGIKLHAPVPRLLLLV